MRQLTPQTPFRYWSTLGRAFATIFKHYLVFLPLVLIILLNIAFLPLSREMNLPLTADPPDPAVFLKFLPLWIGLMIFFFAFSFLVYGWQYALMGQIVKEKMVDPLRALPQGVRLAWKLFKAIMILVGLLILFVLAGVMIGFLLALTPVVGPVIAFLFGLSLFIVVFIVFLAIFYLGPILILEDKEAWESIKLNYHLFWRNKKNVLAMGVRSILILIIAYLPLLVYMYAPLVIAPENVNAYLLQATTSYWYILLSIPLFVAGLGIMMFYMLVYMDKNFIKL